MKHSVQTFDHYFITLIGSLPTSVMPVMQLCYYIGNPAAVLVGAVALAVYGLRIHQWRFVWSAVAVALTIGVGSLIKILVHRLRPVNDYTEKMIIHSYSFPSGHACASMVGYGFLAYLAWRHLPAPWNGVAAAVCIFIILLVGVSRVYLGAHYPSDVVGGWILGAIGLAVAIYVLRHVSA